MCPLNPELTRVKGGNTGYHIDLTVGKKNKRDAMAYCKDNFNAFLPSAKDTIEYKEVVEEIFQLGGNILILFYFHSK